MGPGNEARTRSYGAWERGLDQIIRGLGTRLGPDRMGPGNEARTRSYGAWERG